MRAHYENSVLRLLEPVELRDGEEVLVKIERPIDCERVIERYKGFMGKIGEEELGELIEEAELEKL